MTRYQGLVALSASIVVVFATLLTLAPLGEAGMNLITASFNLFAGVAALAACWYRFKRTEGRRRQAWGFFSAALTSWILGDLFWNFYEPLVGESLPRPSWADLLYLIQLTLMTLGVSRLLPRGSQSRDMRSILDALIVGSSVALLAWALLIPASDPAGASQWVDASLSLAYPLFNLPLPVLALIFLFSASKEDKRLASLLALMAVFQAVGDVGYAWLEVQGAYSTSHPIDALWVASMLCLAVAAAVEPARVNPPNRLRAPQLSSPFTPFAPAALAIVSIIWADLGRGLDRVTLALSITSAAALVARQIVTTQYARKLSARMQDTAYKDDVTGLFSRRRFMEESTERLEVGDAACVLADLDDFKIINDIFGHILGDKVLQVVAERFRKAAPGAFAARLDGDSFAFLVTPDDAIKTANALIDSLSAPVTINGRTARVDVSVGVAVADKGSEGVDIIRQADTAMYAAKERGKNRVAVFDSNMRVYTTEKIKLRDEVSDAFDAGQFRVVYQPIVSLSDGHIEKAEALLRWKDPMRGEISPASFIPVVEDSDLIIRLGAWVLSTACREAAQWPATPGRKAVSVSVNVTPRQLAHADFIEDVKSALSISGLEPSRLILEITESAVLLDAAAATAKLQALRSWGIQVALDDFGTGQSSLSQLKELPVDIIKVDRSFITPLGTSDEKPADITLAEVPVLLARSIGIETVAEGVETVAQAEALDTLGYDYAQGWLYHAAMEADEFIKVAQDNII